MGSSLSGRDSTSFLISYFIPPVDPPPFPCISRGCPETGMTYRDRFTYVLLASHERNTWGIGFVSFQVRSQSVPSSVSIPPLIPSKLNLNDTQHNQKLTLPASSSSVAALSIFLIHQSSRNMAKPLATDREGRGKDEEKERSALLICHIIIC